MNQTVSRMSTDVTDLGFILMTFLLSCSLRPVHSPLPPLLSRHLFHISGSHHPHPQLLLRWSLSAKSMKDPLCPGPGLIGQGHHDDC